MVLHNPLDLEQIFIVDLAGNPEIFSFISMILVAFAMSKFGLPSKLSLPLFALFGVIMGAYMSGIYVLIILFAGIATYYSLSKIGR